MSLLPLSGAIYVDKCMTNVLQIFDKCVTDKYVVTNILRAYEPTLSLKLCFPGEVGDTHQMLLSGEAQREVA